MLQQDKPDDYVIATGKAHTIREFLDLAFGHVDLDWNDYIKIDPRYFRPSEANLLLGDASKAKQEMDWEPATELPELARIMVEHDLESAQSEKQVLGTRG